MLLSELVTLLYVRSLWPTWFRHYDIFMRRYSPILEQNQSWCAELLQRLTHIPYSNLNAVKLIMTVNSENILGAELQRRISFRTAPYTAICNYSYFFKKPKHFIPKTSKPPRTNPRKDRLNFWHPILINWIWSIQDTSDRKADRIAK